MFYETDTPLHNLWRTAILHDVSLSKCYGIALNYGPVSLE